MSLRLPRKVPQLKKVRRNFSHGTKWNNLRFPHQRKLPQNIEAYSTGVIAQPLISAPAETKGKHWKAPYWIDRCLETFL